MAQLSPKQQQIRERDACILEAARSVLLTQGYFGLTMDRVAEASECPKGTIYQRFGSKEDVILALALKASEKRLEMMQRAAAFEGVPRERMVAMGEAVSLYARLFKDDSRIIHTATGPIREKGSEERLACLVAVEQRELLIIHGVLEDAVRTRDLEVRRPGMTQEIAFALWALVDGSFTLMESNSPSAVLGVQDPYTRMFLAFNALADGYGWKPLFADCDWEEINANIRRTVFPVEAQQAYGEGQWYGDRR